MPTSYDDGSTRSIKLSFWWDGCSQPCGRIFFNRSENKASFEYDPSYDGPPIDPIHLNYLRQNTRYFEVDPAQGNDMIHRVFVDYLPGPWGLRVLEAEFPELVQMHAVEKLHWFGSRTVGSFSFFVEKSDDENPVNGIDRLEEIRRRSVLMFTNQIPRFGDLGGLAGIGKSDRWILDNLSSFGGARPKCLFEDREGGQWLAKFNDRDDAYNYARVERALARLAQQCGITAVETRAQAATPDNDILFVRRFDRSEHERRHRVSAFSLMRAEIVKHHSEGDYAMLFELLQNVCCNPEVEKAELVRRMLFNIAVNNTDDHLKNFELLLDRDTHCYRMSPAFDVTVDPYPYPHMTSVFGLKRPDLTQTSMETICTGLRAFGISEEDVMAERSTILKRVSSWKSMMEVCNVTAADVEKLKNAFKSAEQQARSLPDFGKDDDSLMARRSSLMSPF